MTARGVLFALDSAMQARLHDAAEKGDAAVLEIIHEVIEEECPREWRFDLDKAWDAIHRCLTDGELDYENGEPPLSLTILGGYQQIEGDTGDVVSVVPEEEVAAVATALEKVTRDWLHERYLAIDPEDYGMPLSDEDFDYTWMSFEGVPAFYRRAADAGDRAVVFSVDA